MAALRSNLCCAAVLGKMLFLILLLPSVATAVAKEEEERTCSTGEFKCNTTNDCFPMRWQCDGDKDCPDGSDEEPAMCRSKTCKPEQFSCGPSSTCIPNGWVCDGENDCHDGLDERNCTVTQCAADQFSCKGDQRCITQRWVCDYDKDCDDGSDETDCPDRTCPPDSFMCHSDQRCVPIEWKCDGDHDCHDGSDEQECPPSSDPQSPCNSREFMCADRLTCIHNAWRCDGDADCNDQSDEDDCHVTCGPGMFRCNNEQCIPIVYHCDGEIHCTDSSDEQNCARPQTCNESQFDCDGSGSICIELSKVCDNNYDCPINKADERPDLCSEANPCATNNGGCQVTCVNNYHGHFHCECPTGFILDKDNKTCIDKDECQEFGACDQLCFNTLGSYICKCREGYVHDHEQKYCKALGEEPSLLFANRVDLREYGLITGRFRPVVQNTKSAIALDFDFHNNLLFWSDVSKEQINMTSYENGQIQSQVTLTRNVRTPDGLAYDWIHGNLYYTDTGKDIIAVISLSNGNNYHKTLINNNMDEPRAIVVDPRNKERWIYWSDWGEPAKIEKAGLHGGERKAIIQSSNTAISNLQWPNGLTIDYETNRLYWVDAKLHLIGSCDFYGSDQRVILQDASSLQHPFAITVFENYLYWSDWEHESIHKVNKFRGDKMESVLTSLYSPMDVHVFHKLKQPRAVNVCQNHSCSHMCLPVPPISDNVSPYMCACPDSPQLYKLADDQVTCVATVPIVPKHGVVSTPSPRQSVTDKSKNMGSNADQQKSSDAGRVAGIAVGILLAVLIILAVVGYVVYRSYLRKNVKSMNFDNPVYRKTTEDQFSLEKNQYQPSKSLPSTLEPLTANSNECV